MATDQVDRYQTSGLLRAAQRVGERFVRPEGRQAARSAVEEAVLAGKPFLNAIWKDLDMARVEQCLNFVETILVSRYPHGP